MNRIALVAMCALAVACHEDKAAHAIAEQPAVVDASTPVIDAAPSSSSAIADAAASAIAGDAAIPSAISSAPAAPVARVACGRSSCRPNQYCLHYDPGSGGANLPNKAHGDATVCSDVVTNTGSMKCGPPNAARQCSCTAFIPRAPPHE